MRPQPHDISLDCVVKKYRAFRFERRWQPKNTWYTVKGIDGAMYGKCINTFADWVDLHTHRTKAWRII